MKRSTLILLLLLLVIGLRWLWRKPWGGTVTAPPAIGSEPEQQELAAPLQQKTEREGRSYIIERTHAFAISGEVISTATYSWSFANPFYEVDLGLAWGPKVEAYKKKFHFYQGARWLMWSSETPLSSDEQSDLTQHIGNLHLIPANAELDKVSRWIRKGDKVRIQGFLVRILDAFQKPIISSSTRRDDSGDGACEVVWVEAIQIGTRLYR